MCVCVGGGGSSLNLEILREGNSSSFGNLGGRGGGGQKFVSDCWEAVNFVWNNQFPALQFDA